jgi:endonuclease/exonuclease/phosphatase family metal-dependent hydrolase
MAKNQELNEEMRELIEEGTSTSLIKELDALNRNRVNTTTNVEAAVPSDVSTLLERMSGASIAEMDKAIQELQKARNFLRNEKERLRLEIAEHLRLTKAAMGSARAVSENITRFGTVAEDVGKTRAAA